MPKRKKSKPKRPSIASQHGISKKSYENLRREAENTRRRIKNMQRAQGDIENLPNADDFLLKNLLMRVDRGEKPGSLVKEMKRISFDTVRTETERPYRSRFGHYLTAPERERFLKAINSANKAIDKATEKFKDFSDLMPKKFDPQKELDNVVSSDSLNQRIAGLRKFTASRLVPTNIDGIFTTQAEYEFLTDTINRENERREARQQQPKQGYLITQADYDSKPINIDKLQDINAIRRKASQWDDPARVDRANRYLDLYLQKLNDAQAVLKDNGVGGQRTSRMFNRMRKVISKLYNDVDRVTDIAQHMPDIDITIVSGVITGDMDIYELYTAWDTYGKDLDADIQRGL